MKKDAPAERARLAAAIAAEIANTRRWLTFLSAARSEAFRVTNGDETPFLYKTPAEDLTLKLEVMQAHANDSPVPYLKELTEPLSVRNLLYFGE
ncbi:MAG: hypothetical protein IT168_20485 [Bryobacterales bacterium]|nr:hypothetical protein [Bryobacterales bacterium]